MINWQSVIFNSFWILGLALLLAALSYYAWLASENALPMRAQLGAPGFQRYFWVAAGLVAIGLAGTSSQLWEMILWSGLALLAFLNAFAISVR